VRNKLKAPLPLREILQRALKLPLSAPPSPASPAASDTRLSALAESWLTLVGQAIAANSRPYRLNGQVLVIEVSAPVWANELSFLKIPLLEKIRGLPDFSKLPKLEDIRCQIATRSASDKGLKTKPLKSFG